MTVKDLIEKLKECPQDYEVVMARWAANEPTGQIKQDDEFKEIVLYRE